MHTRMNPDTWQRILLLVLLSWCSSVHAGGAEFHSGLLLYDGGLPEATLNAAAEAANQMAGTNVEVSTTPDGDFSKVLVTTDGDAGGLLALTVVDDNNTPDPSDDVAVGIVINLEKLKTLFPGILEDPDLLRRILTYLLAHEFRHVPGNPGGPGGSGQGGLGHSGGTACEHLADYVADCAGICQDVSAAIADASMKPADKCKLVAALCTLHKHIRDHANSAGNVNAAENCPGVTVTNGEIVASCDGCPMGDCPVHGHSYGGE